MPTEKEIRQIEDDLSDEERIETTYRRLRRDGYSRMEAVRVLLEVLDLSLSEAKELLLTTETWAEARAATAPQDSSSGGTDDEPSVPPAPA